MSVTNPGGLVGRKKWLVHRYPKPAGALIILGSILTDPEEPETSLNRKAGVLKVPEADEIDDSVAVRREIHSELSSNASVLLKAVAPISPLFNASIVAKGQSSDDVRTTVDAMNVSAKSFLPDKSYVDQALSRPEITAFVDGVAWSAPLYMIVGVATASTLTVAEEQSRDTNAALNTGTSIPGTGAGVAGDLSYRRIAEAGTRFETAEATDFAYRVKEFDYCKFRLGEKFKDKGDRFKGAMFGTGESHNGDAGRVYIPAFEKWAEEDSQPSELYVIGA